MSNNSKEKMDKKIATMKSKASKLLSKFGHLQYCKADENTFAFMITDVDGKSLGDLNRIIKISDALSHILCDQYPVVWLARNEDFFYTLVCKSK